jgi:hypothetical protein
MVPDPVWPMGLIFSRLTLLFKLSAMAARLKLGPVFLALSP